VNALNDKIITVKWCINDRKTSNEHGVSYYVIRDATQAVIRTAIMNKGTLHGDDA